MFELYQLEQLISIAENKTLSKAAEELHISQPTLSRTMQKLEEELGMPLFERQKNKIELNENGLLAVECAKKVMDEANAMTKRLQALEKSRHTLAIGSCAPAPLWDLTPFISKLYPELTIVSEMQDEDILLNNLQNNEYQLIVLPHPIENDNYINMKYLSEQLYISLPPAHPLCGHEGIYLSDLDGESMLLYSQIGFWHNLHITKMPNTHFLIQQERETFDVLTQASAFPSFTSDLVMTHEGKKDNRVILPILDSEASVTYYCCMNKSNMKKYNSLLLALSEFSESKA